MYPSHFYITLRRDYKTTIQKIAQKAFLDLCKQIFSKGRSQTIRQFFEREYKVSFPIEIICCYYDKMICERDKDLVEKIHGSLSKKIEDLEDDSYDFLLMSNLCRRVLWRKKKKKKKIEGAGEREEKEDRIIKKLMRLMKKLVYEINLIHYEYLLCDEKFYSQKFTRSMLLDKINNFQNLLADTLQEAQFSIIMYSETSVRDLKEQLKAKVDALFKRIIDKGFDASNPSDIARFKEEELKDFDTLRWRAIIQMREEIIKSRNVWLAQNRVYYTIHSDYVPLNLEFDEKFHNVWDKDNNRKDCRLINQYQLLNVKFGDETRNNLSSVVVVNGDASVEKTIMLLDLVKIFDDEKGRFYTETSSDAEEKEKFYSATPMIEKAARQQQLQNIFDRINHPTEEISAAVKIRDDIRRLGRYIRRFDILFYIPMKNGKFEKFEEYLKSLLPQTLEKSLLKCVTPPPGLGLPLDGSYDLGQVLDTLSQSKCLILCDGYDEANDKSRKLFDELLRFNFQEGCKFIVTTRRNNETPKLIKIIDDARISRIILNITT